VKKETLQGEGRKERGGARSESQIGIVVFLSPGRNFTDSSGKKNILGGETKRRPVSKGSEGREMVDGFHPEKDRCPKKDDEEPPWEKSV